MHTHLDRSWQGVLGRILPHFPPLPFFRYHLLVTREPGCWVVQTADITRLSLLYHTSPTKKGDREEGTKVKETVLWKEKLWESLQSGTWGDGVASWDLPFSGLLAWTALLDLSCLPLPARGLRGEPWTWAEQGPASKCCSFHRWEPLALSCFTGFQMREVEILTCCQLCAKSQCSQQSNEDTYVP